VTLLLKCDAAVKDQNGSDPLTYLFSCSRYNTIISSSLSFTTTGSSMLYISIYCSQSPLYEILYLHELPQKVGLSLERNSNRNEL
jgi:hypothetical protein